MKKIFVFFVVFISSILVFTSTFAAPVWPTYTGNFQRTFMSPYDTSNNTGNLKWVYNSVGGSPVIGPDGTIYVEQVSTIDYNQIFYLAAISPNGTLKWEYEIFRKSVFEGGDLGDVIVGSDGTIYVNVLGRGKLADNGIYAINPNGTLKWHVGPLEDNIRSYSYIAEYNGTVYAGEGDTLFALNSTDGSTKWKYMLYSGDVIRSELTIGTDGTIYFGSTAVNSGGHTSLYAINPNGTLKWCTGIGDIGGTPAIIPIDPFGRLYVMGTSFTWRINPDGTKDGSIVDTYLSFGGTDYSGLYFTASNIYALYPDSSGSGAFPCVYILNYDGSLKKQIFIPKTVGNLERISSLAIGVDGTMYYSTVEYDYQHSSYVNFLNALYPNGQLKWRINCSDFAENIAIGSDGTLYVIEYVIGSGGLYAYGNVLHNVNFTVKDSNGNAVSNATITINSSILTTNSNGQATIQLSNGTYNYIVSKTGYKAVSNSLVVNNSDLSVNIILYESVSINNVSLDSSNNTYKAGQAVKINVTTTGPVYRVTAQMWYNSNDFGNTGITDLVNNGNGGWHTRQSSSEGYDTVVIIPKNTPDGTYNITITAYARYPDGTTDIKSIIIPITVKGTIYDYYHSEINN